MAFNLKNLFGKIEKAAASLAGSGNLANPFSIWLGSSKKIGPLEAMSYYSGWVYTCIRAIAEEIAGTEIQLKKNDGKGNETEIYDHELLDLINCPNAYQTGYDLLYNLVAHLELTGNAYLYLGEVNNENEKPKTLQLLSPSSVKVIKAPFPDFIAGYQYQDGTKMTKLETYQVIHFKYNDPSDPFNGIGTVQAIIDWIRSEEYQTQFNLRYFKNGARIGGFIESENAQTPEQLEYLKRSFDKAASGLENAHKTLALPKGTTYKDGSTSPKDMDFNGGQLVSRDKVMAGFRTPKTVLGITDDVNRANAEATNYVFALRTVLPKIKLVFRYLNEFLTPRFDDRIKLFFPNPVPEDRVAKMEELKAGTAGQPVLSANEARQEYFGLDPIEGGDEVMTSFNMVPLGALKPKVETPAKSIVYKNRIGINKEKKKTFTNAIVSGVADMLKDVNFTSKGKKDISQLSEKEFEPVYKAFAARVTKYEKAQKAIVVKVNDKIREEVVSNLNKVVKTKAVNPEDLYNQDDAVGLMIDLSKPNLFDLYEKEGIAAAALLGFNDIEMMTPAAKAALERALSLLSESYNDTTKQLLKVKLEQGLADGLGLEEITKSVNEVFDYCDEVRAGQVARTETFRIANESTKEAWKNTGVVKTIKWYTAEDERVCEFCGPMSEKVISIDDNFFSKGDSVEGSEGGNLDLTYDDVGNPPLHVGCRCYQRPDEISLDKGIKTEEIDEDKEVDNLLATL